MVSNINLHPYRTVSLWHTIALAAFYSVYICLVVFQGDGGGSGGGGGGGSDLAPSGAEGDEESGGNAKKQQPLFDLASQKGGRAPQPPLVIARHCITECV